MDNHISDTKFENKYELIFFPSNQKTLVVLYPFFLRVINMLVYGNGCFIFPSSSFFLSFFFVSQLNFLNISPLMGLWLFMHFSFLRMGGTIYSNHHNSEGNLE